MQFRGVWHVFWTCFSLRVGVGCMMPDIYLEFTRHWSWILTDIFAYNKLFVYVYWTVTSLLQACSACKAKRTVAKETDARFLSQWIPRQATFVNETANLFGCWLSLASLSQKQARDWRERFSRSSEQAKHKKLAVQLYTSSARLVDRGRRSSPALVQTMSVIR